MAVWRKTAGEWGEWVELTAPERLEWVPMPQETSISVYLENRTAGAFKFWKISVSQEVGWRTRGDFNIVTAWGKIGTIGQSKTDLVSSVTAAEFAAVRAIKEKLKRGYLPVQGYGSDIRIRDQLPGHFGPEFGFLDFTTWDEPESVQLPTASVPADYGNEEFDDSILQEYLSGRSAPDALREILLGLAKVNAARTGAQAKAKPKEPTPPPPPKEDRPNSLTAVGRRRFILDDPES